MRPRPLATPDLFLFRGRYHRPLSLYQLCLTAMPRPTKSPRYVPELLTIYARNIELQALKRGWTARRLADEIGVTPPALARVRHAQNKVIDPELLASLLRIFECDANALFLRQPDVDYSSPLS